MNTALATTVIVLSLAVAAWCLVSAARNNAATWGHLLAAAVVELAALVQVAVAVVRLASGTKPTELATFIGYLVVSAVVLPAGAWLATLERSRWGSAILGAACVVLTVIVLRLQQVWHG
ncbi:MAG TPA: hypothetical protein VFC00_32900 [Micromonosporaceae bacterium]|nr:hypothetical protein [Micromonosporaceae bacterium]